MGWQRHGGSVWGRGPWRARTPAAARNSLIIRRTGGASGIRCCHGWERGSRHGLCLCMCAFFGLVSRCTRPFRQAPARPDQTAAPTVSLWPLQSTAIAGRPVAALTLELTARYRIPRSVMQFHSGHGVAQTGQICSGRIMRRVQAAGFDFVSDSILGSAFILTRSRNLVSRGYPVAPAFLGRPKAVQLFDGR